MIILISTVYSNPSRITTGNLGKNSYEKKFADPVVLPSTEVLHARMAAFHERMANPPAAPTNSAGQQNGQPRMGERQFTV